MVEFQGVSGLSFPNAYSFAVCNYLSKNPPVFFVVHFWGEGKTPKSN